MNIQQAFHKLVDRQDLTEEEMISVMDQIMEGQAKDSLISAFLTALRLKGECVSEILGAARVMRKKAETLDIHADNIVDTCGTGGDGADTFNISTTSAFVVAGAGITVAKHGNTAVSSSSGSADVLQCLGVNIRADKAVVEKCLNEVGIGFLFAPLMHKAMKHAIGVRKELGIRTIFNLLGPLTNPAKTRAQVVGVYNKQWTSPLAQTLKELGIEHAFVVHGEDGLDEITLTDNTNVSELRDGKIMDYLIGPEQFGMSRCSSNELKGGTPEDNACLLQKILKGELGPKRDIVLLNASAAITASGKSESLVRGIEVARNSIDSGAAYKKLQDLCRVSHS